MKLSLIYNFVAGIAILCLCMVNPSHLNAATVAHWDMADNGAVNDAWMPGNGERVDLDSDGAMDTDDFRIGSTDLSGNGNHLTAWSSAWMKWTNDSIMGDFSMTTPGSYPAAGTDSSYNPYITGIDIETWQPTAWTIEAYVKPSSSDVSGGHHSVVGRDGYGGYSPDPALAQLYFGIIPNGDFRIKFNDVSGYNHEVLADTIFQANVWYHLAATCDGSTLKLYVNGQQVGSTNLTLSGSPDTSLAYDTDTGGDPYCWTVSRGMWNNTGDVFGGGHTDRFFGLVDEVAISDTALEPGQFVARTLFLLTESDNKTVLWASDITKTDDYSIVLTQQPTDTVTVTVTPPAGITVGNGSGQPLELVFDDQNWNQPQDITVQFADSADFMASPQVITHTTQSNDLNYDDMTLHPIRVYIVRGQEPIVFNDNGVWCWFQDERAIVHNGKLIIGSVADASGSNGGARDGNVEVVQYDIATETVSAPFVLHAGLDSDDHAAPAFLPLPDDHILAVYATHGNDSYMRYRTSANVNDASGWNSEQIYTAGAGVTYSNVFRLSAENGGSGRIYNFYRGENYNPNFVTSDDNGQTWTYGLPSVTTDGRLIAIGTGGTRPYVKYTSNKVDIIHFITTEGHPRNYNNSIYYGYLYQGKLYDAGGNELHDTANGGIAPTSLQNIYQGGSNNVAWTTDIALDSDGYPYCAFSVQMNQNMNDMRYWYARWDGSQWHVNEMAYAGTALYSAEDDYTGLVALDPQNPNVLYISSDADPVTSEPLISAADGQRHYELFRGTTTDLGASWTWESITKDSLDDNIRPIIPQWDGGTILLWCKGTYTSYFDWDMDIVGLFDPQPITEPQVSHPLIRPASDIHNDTIDWMKKVANWQLSQGVWDDSVDWQWGALHAGIMACYEATKDEIYLDKIRQWADSFNWQLGYDSNNADNVACAQAYLELYFLDQQDSYRYQDFKNQSDSHISLWPSFNCDTTSDSDVWWWCDALFMAPPALTRLSQATGDPTYTNFMHMMWEDTQDCLYDTTEHLFFRDIAYYYPATQNCNGDKMFWSRGNGWVLAGTARMLQYLPMNDPERPKYVTLLQEMAAKLKSIQQPDGFWYSDLLGPNCYDNPESSGTGFFTFGIAWGINNGYLEEATYWPTVQAGWQALKGAVQPDGLLGWVQPVGAGPQSTSATTTDVFGVGAYLLAGSEVQKFLLAHDLNIIDCFESYANNTALQGKWTDGSSNGTASLVSLGDYGDNFMELTYQNAQSPYRSETTYTFSAPKDVTENNAYYISILTRGQPGNASEQMYVRLADVDMNTAVQVINETNVVKNPQWMELGFPLSEFEGVDLTNVTQLTIGVGTPDASTPTGQGTIRIDTIRLSHPTCSLVQKDFDGDCRISMGDFAIFAGQWMDDYRVTVAPMDPGTSNLVAYWSLDGNYTDATGYHNASPAAGGGTLSFINPGQSGQSVNFDGNSGLECANSENIHLTNGGTISTWIKSSTQTDDWACIIAKGIGTWRLIRNNYATGNEVSFHIDSTGGTPYQANGSTNVLDNEWHHVMGVYNDSSIRLYIDGELDASANTSGATLTTSSDLVYIGSRVGRLSDRSWYGQIDEVRIYDTALSTESLLWLSENPSYIEVPETLRQTDLAPDGLINFADLVNFVEHWTQDYRWP